MGARPMAGSFAGLVLLLAAVPALADDGRCGEGLSFWDDGWSRGCQRVSSRARAVGESSVKPVRVGLWQTRNARGEIVFEATYDERGQENGFIRRWYSPGKNEEHPRRHLAEERYNEHGQTTGLVRRWYAPGCLTDMAPSEEGLAEKNLRDVRRGRQGQWHGVSEHWSADGHPDGSRCYVCGERSSMEECGNPDLAMAACPGKEASRALAGVKKAR